MAKIIVDAFGGDNAPLEVLRGCERAVRELGSEIILTGSSAKIKKCAADNGIRLSGMKIAHTDDVFDIHEEPREITKSGKNTSMALGLRLLSEGRADAFVSAGSTGALVMGTSLIVKRIKGIRRIAPSPILPADKGSFMLVDAGANIECRPEMLVQFAAMGSAYMEKVMGIDSPKVALLNIGAEETKGRELELEAYKLLSESGLNFVGNIEARDMPKGEVQVVVTDGFTGNVALKLYEGMGAFFRDKMKWIFSGIGKAGALLSLGKIKEFRKQMDYKEVGGSALLGASRPVIKAHGSSDGTAFFNAVRQAEKVVEGNVCGEIEKYVASLSASKGNNNG
ncbi:MAG: phosphate acyltransferase PlsX [Ruminococcus sp.]|nr:phosphate acyltransferase PlsX [Ruminococcus sp.]